MGNVNESQERKNSSLSEELTDASSPVCETDEAFLDSSLEQDALNADIPIKLFLGPPCDDSEMASTASGMSTVEAPLEAGEAFMEINEGNSYTELPREDSFPLPESVLPSSFDLLAESCPSVADDLDSSESSNVPRLHSVGLINVKNDTYSSLYQCNEVIETGEVDDCPDGALTLQVSDQEKYLESGTAIDKLSTDEPNFSPTLFRAFETSVPLEGDKLNLEADGASAIACFEGVVSPLFISEHILYQSTPKERDTEASIVGQHMSSDDSLSDVEINLPFGFDWSNTIFASSPFLIQDILTTGDDADVTLCALQIGDGSIQEETEFKPDLLNQSGDILGALLEPNADTPSELPEVTPAAPLDCNNVSAPSIESVAKDNIPYQQLAENDLVISSGAQDCDVFTEPESSPEMEAACDALSGPSMDTTTQSETPAGYEFMIPLPPSPTLTHHEVDEFTELLVTQKDSPKTSLSVNPPSAETNDHSSLQAGNRCDHCVGESAILDYSKPTNDLPAANAALENPTSSITRSIHTEDHPNWAVAPVLSSVDVKSAPSKRLAKSDERRISNGKGKQKRDDPIPKKKVVKFEDPPVSSSIEKLECDDSPYMQTRAPTPPRSGSAGKVRRPRGASVSMLVDTPAPKAASTKGGHTLSRISEPPAAKTSRSYSMSVSSGPSRKEESVEDKIAAIILETRRSRPGKGQTVARTKTPNALGVAKSIPEIKISPPTSTTGECSKKEQFHREGRVSWPASEENEQSTVRTPLPWRTGIGRALTTHLATTPVSSTRSWSDADKRDHGNFTSKQDVFKGTTLQPGHDDFRLDSFERDGPVKVNLPTTSKTRNNLQKLQAPTVKKMASVGNISSQPTFQSSIPVSNKVFANKAVGPEETEIASLAASVKQPNNAGWQSTTTLTSRTDHSGPFDHPSTTTFSHLGHRNDASNQTPRAPQNTPVTPQQSTTFSGLPNYAHEFSWGNQSGSEYSSIFPQARVPDVAPSFPLQTIAGSHEHMLHQPRQQLNTQDLINLNHWYVQGQQLRARGQVERTTLNRQASVVFPNQVPRVNHQEIIDGWRSGYNMTYQSHQMNTVPQTYRRPVYESTLPTDTNQQYQSRRVSDRR